MAATGPGMKLAGCLLVFLVAACSRADRPAPPPPETSERVEGYQWPEIDEPYRELVYRGGISVDEEAEAWETLPIETISLDSDGCFGTCPQYTVTFHRGGEATFDGREYVDLLWGFREGRIYVRDYARLCMFIEYFHVRDMQPYYSAPWTDDNTLTLRVRFRGEDEDVVVSDYGQQGPPELHAVILAIEEQVRQVEWGLPKGR